MLLAPLALAYGFAVARRNARFDRGVGVHRADVPVISVGNITVGGTGKTPLTMLVVQHLLDLGRKPAIVTRGYAARPGQTADEVLEYRSELPGVPIAVDADRVAAAARAVREHADCIVLDDGFQHRRLARDLDIVLVDATNPWGGGSLLPAGRLREPKSSLGRAGVIVLTRRNLVDERRAGQLERELRKLAPARVPILAATQDAANLIGLDGSAAAPQSLADRCVMPACGIGNPGAFVTALQPLVGRLVEGVFFRDHHPYTSLDVRRLVEAAAQRDADTIVVTRKDWVKLAPLWVGQVGPERDAPDLMRLDGRPHFDAHDLSLLDDALRGALREAA
jgi:tetraacyldisaccharide 4'-kinase